MIFTHLVFFRFLRGAGAGAVVASNNQTTVHHYHHAG